MLKRPGTFVAILLLAMPLNAQESSLPVSPDKNVTVRPSLDELMVGFRRLEDFHRGLKVVERTTIAPSAYRHDEFMGLKNAEGKNFVVTVESSLHEEKDATVTELKLGDEILDLSSPAVRKRADDLGRGGSMPVSDFAVFPLERYGMMFFGDRRLSRYFDASVELFSLRWSGETAIVRFSANDGRSRFEIHLKADVDGLWGPVQYQRVIRSAGQIHEFEWRLENFTADVQWMDPGFCAKGFSKQRVRRGEKELFAEEYRFEVVSRESLKVHDVWHNYSFVPQPFRPMAPPKEVLSIPSDDARDSAELTAEQLASMTLDDVIKRFEEVEWSYLPFHVETVETTTVDRHLPTTDANSLQAFEGFATVQYAGRVEGDWRLMKDYRHTVRSRTSDFSRTLRKPGEILSASRWTSQDVFPIISLAGVFPLAGLEPISGEIPMLSDFARKNPDKIKLEWEDRVAKLTAQTEYEGFKGDVSVWLRPDLKWHPVQMKQFRQGQEGIPVFEWHLHQVDVSGQFARVLSGQGRQLLRPGDSPEDSRFDNIDFRIKGNRFQGAVRENVFSLSTPVGGSPLPPVSLPKVVYDIKSNASVTPQVQLSQEIPTPAEVLLLKGNEIERELSKLRLQPDGQSERISELQKELDRIRRIQQYRKPLTVFHLSQAKAIDLCMLLIERYPEEYNAFTVDEKLNAVLARVEEPMRTEIGELVNKLEGQRRQDWPAGKPIGNVDLSRLYADPHHIKLFRHHQGDFENTKRILTELYSGTGQVISADDARRLFIVRGTPEQLQEVEAAIRDLQSQPLKVPDTDLNFQNLSEIRRQWRNADSRAKATARNIRLFEADPLGETPAIKKQIAELMVQLEKEVHSARILEQQVRHFDLSQFEERLKNLRQIVDAHDKLSDRIVQKRVAELLEREPEAREAQLQTARVKIEVFEFDPGEPVLREFFERQTLMEDEFDLEMGELMKTHRISRAIKQTIDLALAEETTIPHVRAEDHHSVSLLVNESDGVPSVIVTMEQSARTVEDRTSELEATDARSNSNRATSFVTSGLQYGGPWKLFGPFPARNNRVWYARLRITKLAASDATLISPEEVLTVVLRWGLAADQHQELSVRVAEDGSIQLPTIGSVSVGGRTLKDAENQIVESATVKKQLFTDLTVFITRNAEQP